MTPEIKEMETELERLLTIRDQAVGVDLKRTNYQIAQLQNRIKHAEEAL